MENQYFLLSIKFHSFSVVELFSLLCAYLQVFKLILFLRISSSVSLFSFAVFGCRGFFKKSFYIYES